MAPLGVAVIGCGRIAQSVHLPVLARLPGVRVVALADPDSSRRALAQRRAPGAVARAGFADALDLPQVEAAVVCVPNEMHAEIAAAAFERGKHVYIEKPIAASLDDGRRVVEAWRRAGRLGMVGFNYRFNPLYAAARRLVREGRLGEPYLARSVFSSAARDQAPWLRRRSTGGGVLLDLASHHVDLALWMFGGRVREVRATVWSRASEDDTATLELRLSEGLVVQSSFALAGVDEDRLEVYGGAGRLSLDRYRSHHVDVAGSAAAGAWAGIARRALREVTAAPYGLRKRLAPGHEPSYRAALAAFVAAARGERVAHPSVLDGYRSLAVVAAAEESAATGRVVLLDADAPSPAFS